MLYLCESLTKVRERKCKPPELAGNTDCTKADTLYIHSVSPQQRYRNAKVIEAIVIQRQACCTFIFCVPTRSTRRCSFLRKRRVMSFTQGGRVALKSRVCMFSDDPPAFRIISTSSTKPMFSISSHSSRTRYLQTWTNVEHQA